MRMFFTTMICVAASCMTGCATVQHLSDVVWQGDTVNVTAAAAEQIGADTADLLDTHYKRSAAFQIVATEENPVTDHIIQHLRDMGYAVDVVYQGSRRGAHPFQPGEVLMSLGADNLGFKDIVRVEVNVDRVTATRIYTNASGIPTGPWTVTAVPKAEVIVGDVYDRQQHGQSAHGAN